MASPKLNQIIAVCSGKKTELEKHLTSVYQSFDKAKELCSGLIKVYEPKDEGGETLPQETKGVQLKVSDSLSNLKDVMVSTFDAVLTQEKGNTEAKADVLVDDVAVLKDVPVSYLLYLEKRVTDLGTFISKLPVLDPSDTWTYDANSGVNVTAEVFTNRTKKVPRTLVKAEATEKHPAQVDVYHEDVVVGQFKTKKFSGCLSADQKHKMMVKVKKLEQAIKFAREEANSLVVQQQKCGEKVYDFLFN